MTQEIDLAEWEQETAVATVNRFVGRFQPSYLLLAYHAALPLVLTPELVNYLRNQFLKSDNVPWVAEVDLLLSELCSQVGYELYAMDTHIRSYLIQEMKEHYGPKRMREVAQDLISYVNYLSRINPGRREKELEVQRWAAMVFLGDDYCNQVAEEIARRFLEANAQLTESEIRVEFERLAQITKDLSPQLQGEPSLLEFAQLVQRLLKRSEEVDPSDLTRSYPVGNLELKLSDEVLPENLREFPGTIFEDEGIQTSQTFQEEVAVGVESQGIDSTIDLQSFEFEVAEIKFDPSSESYKIERYLDQARGYREDLGNNVHLEMVYIPEGVFMMGSPEDEEGHEYNESPLHEVSVKPFFMGKYPITQAQWKEIASLPQVNRELKLDPSRFKGSDRPVERVTWNEAVEFCDRLSRKTGREYRLPSEAEWEYACRAGTTTPFHFGETITTDLANYDGNYIYGFGSTGIYRKETSSVGSFKAANRFGLYDMHGNVWELCLDHWHYNYEGAPNDGSARINEEQNDNENNSYRRLGRGGSWGNNPQDCRSAYRFYYWPDDSNLVIVIGFRVVCSVGWTS